jgi:outer membrane protein assembly factor BamA
MGSGMMNNVTNGLNNGGASYLPTGVRNYSFQADWVEPSLRGSKTSLGLSSFARSNASMMVDDSSQRTLGASATLSRALGKNWKVRSVLAVKKHLCEITDWAI